MDNLFDLGAILAFIGSLIAFIFNHRTTAAGAKAVEVDTDAKYQRQIDHLVQRNGELFEKIEAMREMYEDKIFTLETRLEKERQNADAIIRGLKNDIANMRAELRSEQERNRSAISRTRTEIGEVKKDVKRITGPLPYPPDREV
jgi:chromosome segregation ATPase